jgi:hypothetical protein
MAGINEMNLSMRQVSLEGFRARRDETRNRLTSTNSYQYSAALFLGIWEYILQLVIFSPYSKQRYLRLAKVLLKLWIQRKVVSVVIEIIQLDVDISGLVINERVIQPPRLRLERCRILCAGDILGRCCIESEKRYESISVTKTISYKLSRVGAAEIPRQKLTHAWLPDAQYVLMASNPGPIPSI